MRGRPNGLTIALQPTMLRTEYPMAWYGTSTFEFDANEWRPYNIPRSVTATVVSDGTARSGTKVLRCRTGVASGSVAADIPVSVSLPVSGLDPRAGIATVTFALPAVAVLAFVRSKPGGPSVSGRLTVWESDSPTSPNHPDLKFSVGNDWTLLTHAVRFLGSPTTVRVEFYIDTANVDFDIDFVSVS